MKIIIFGATGSIGKHLVGQAVEAGHEVTAFCRDTARAGTLKQSGCQLYMGDVLDPHAVHKAVKGHDAVCIALGSGSDRKSTIRSKGTKNIIDAMQVCGVSRLICQTTLGAGESRGNLNFFWKRIMFGWYLKKVFLVHELQEDFVQASGLVWTIVRPVAFTNGELTGKYRHGFGTNDRTVKLRISRADVAHFILLELSNATYLHQAPGLSY